MTASTPERTTGTESADPVTLSLLGFLAERTRTQYAPDEDLFASGGISSLFAMELVLHLEQEFGVTVTGPELKVDNFRTAEAMTALVHRLNGTELGCA